MKTTRILSLKLAKRLRHRKEVYKSYIHTPRPTVSLPICRLLAKKPAERDSHPSIFFRPRERRAIAQAALASSPDTCRATIAEAERTCTGEVEVFGDRLDLSGGIHWHTDHLTGRTWPKMPAPHLSIIYTSDKSDIKAPWELARCQFLGALGRAWAYTGNEKYPKCARQTIESFLADNPLGIGLHWINPMESAIRAANWIVADNFFAGATAWDEDFRRQLKLSLYDHGRFIRSHLERDGRGINSNHYTANLAGLFILGLCLHDIEGCDEWSDFAIAELDTEIDIQIAPDGMNYENSLGYHRLMFEMLFYTHRLGKMNGVRGVDRWESTLARMAAFTLAVIMPNGKVPNFGDNDDGLWLGGSPRFPDDHRYLVLLSATAFDRPNPAHVEYTFDEIPEDVFWYLGRDAAQRLSERRVREKQNANDSYADLPPAVLSTLLAQTSVAEDHETCRSKVFSSSGIIIMRSAKAYVMVGANPVGTGGIGGHKHNDMLSYIFAVGDDEIVVDPGTYAYTAEPLLRNQFRSTAAHNTVMVDNTEQNRFAQRQLFWLREDARPEIRRWESGARMDRLIVQQDGYCRLPGGVIHTRTFVFDKTNHILALRDELDGTGIHDLRSTVNFGAGTLNADDPRRVVLNFHGANAQAGFLFATIRPWHFKIETAWRSVRYREKKPMFRGVLRCRIQLPTSWTTVIGVFNQSIDWGLLENASTEYFHEPVEPIVPDRQQQEPACLEVCK